MTRQRILFNHLADVSLFTRIASAGHTGTTVAADFFIPSLVWVILANPADAVTDWAIGICHRLPSPLYFLDNPLNELARKRPSDVMSRYSTSATKVGSTHVALGFLMGLVSLDFGLTTVSSCFLIWLETVRDHPVPTLPI